MVEQALVLDGIFGALANHYRRDILRRAAQTDQTAGPLAKSYGLTIAAVVKHFNVLEKAGLITTRKKGKERYASLATDGVVKAAEHLAYYERFWNQQLDSLESHLRRTATDV